MTLTVYGIPTCGTVKKLRSWLDAHQLPHGWVDFRAAPPSAGKVAGWVAAFGVNAMKNTSGGSYRALGAEKDQWTEAEWTAAFTRDPMLIKRPVLERDGAAWSVGLREERLQALLAAG